MPIKNAWRFAWFYTDFSPCGQGDFERGGLDTVT